LKEKFRNLWLEDKKVKLKAREDLGYEVFEHRTIVVRNLPFSFQKRHLVEMFSQFGALVNIELPVKNLAIE
jgi:RNA recognition motif-containing protein